MKHEVICYATGDVLFKSVSRRECGQWIDDNDLGLGDVSIKEKPFTFKDLVFKSHKVFPKAWASRMEFDNGTFISVVGGHEFLYGNGFSSFEIMSTVTDRRGEFGGVDSWMSVEQITRRMRYLQTLPKTIDTRKNEGGYHIITNN